MAQQIQPDWHKIAEKFDMWLPYIKPAGDNMLEAVSVQKGDKVLDIASGTGEPALTLAQQMGNSIHIIGTDAAEGMVKVAQEKVDRLGLENIEFMAMSGDNLEFSDNTFDKLICRFGIMFFDDVLAGLKEMCRVLKSDGAFAFAVWNTAETMPVMQWSYQAFKNKIADDELPPIDMVTSMSVPGVLQNLLIRAGYTDLAITRHTLDYRFDSFESYCDIVEASDILKMQFDALPDALRSTVKDEVARFAQDFVTENGLVVPHEYLVASGTKA